MKGGGTTARFLKTKEDHRANRIVRQQSPARNQSCQSPRVISTRYLALSPHRDFRPRRPRWSSSWEVTASEVREVPQQVNLLVPISNQPLALAFHAITKAKSRFLEQIEQRPTGYRVVTPF